MRATYAARDKQLASQHCYSESDEDDADDGVDGNDGDVDDGDDSDDGDDGADDVSKHGIWMKMLAMMVLPMQSIDRCTKEAMNRCMFASIL